MINLFVQLWCSHPVWCSILILCCISLALWLFEKTAGCFIIIVILGLILGLIVFLGTFAVIIMPIALIIVGVIILYKWLKNRRFKK